MIMYHLVRYLVNGQFVLPRFWRSERNVGDQDVAGRWKWFIMNEPKTASDKLSQLS